MVVVVVNLQQTVLFKAAWVEEWKSEWETATKIINIILD